MQSVQSVRMLTWHVHTTETWQVHTATHGRSIQKHVVTPGSDTWHAVLVDLAYGWTNPEVTHVTTKRVTCGTGDMAG
jgi:hypothetical protein